MLLIKISPNIFPLLYLFLCGQQINSRIPMRRSNGIKVKLSAVSVLQGKNIMP